MAIAYNRGDKVSYNANVYAHDAHGWQFEA